MTENVMAFEDDDEETTNIEEAAEGKLVSPLRALRRHCLWCCNGSSMEVKLCPAKVCPLWRFRLGRRPTAEDKAAVADMPIYPFERPTAGGEYHKNGGTALKAIRRKCCDCSGGSLIGASGCTVRECALHPFRTGRNPNIRLSKERRAMLSARLSALHTRNGGQCLTRIHTFPAAGRP